MRKERPCENCGVRAGRIERRARGEAEGKVAELFRAFSDENRLRILHVLRQGEICVGDLVKILRVPQARVSRHLAYLRRTRLVLARKRGLWMYYSLAPARGNVHQTLLGCLSGCFQGLPQFARDARRRKTVAKAGGCCPI